MFYICNEACCLIDVIITLRWCHHDVTHTFVSILYLFSFLSILASFSDFQIFTFVLHCTKYCIQKKDKASSLKNRNNYSTEKLVMFQFFEIIRKNLYDKKQLSKMFSKDIFITKYTESTSPQRKSLFGQKMLTPTLFGLFSYIFS